MVSELEAPASVLIDLHSRGLEMTWQGMNWLEAGKLELMMVLDQKLDLMVTRITIIMFKMRRMVHVA